MTKSFKDILPKRSRKVNKSAGGKCLIIAGSRGMWGAGVLSGRAATRVGAGYVFLATDRKHFATYKHPDFLTLSISDKIDFSKFSSIAIGPGLKPNNTLKKIIKKLIKISFEKVVLDAGALDIIAQEKMHLPKTWIATPHEGELARVLDTTSEIVSKDRLASIRKAQKSLNCIVVLKGHGTLIATSQKTYVNKSGNKALAKAGTGDVLTGIIAGLLAQGLAPLKAAQLGVLLHGHIADDWIKEKNDYLSLIASDLIERIPKTLHQLRK